MPAEPIPTHNDVPRRSFRIARTLALATLLGLTLTIATTWAQALLLKPRTWHHGTELVGHNLGWPWTPPEGWPEGANCISQSSDGTFLHSSTPREARMPPDGKPTWIYPRSGPIEGIAGDWVFSSDFFMKELRYGWPILAMRRVPNIYKFGESWDSPITYYDLNTLSHRLRIGLKLHPNWPEVPHAPVWPGFILHTAFWTLASLASHHALITFRTRRRQRHGECTRCRYPIHYLPRCPECGTPTPPPLAASTSPAE